MFDQAISNAAHFKKVRKQIIDSAPIVMFSAIVALVAALNVIALCWLFHLATSESALLGATLMGLTIFVTLLLIYGNRDPAKQSELPGTPFGPTRSGMPTTILPKKR